MIIYKVEFEHVSPIAHPEYYDGDEPAVPPEHVLNEHWTKVDREGSESSIMEQYRGLMELIGRRQLIRNVKVYRAEMQEPEWIDITPPNVSKVENA